MKKYIDKTENIILNLWLNFTNAISYQCFRILSLNCKNRNLLKSYVESSCPALMIFHFTLSINFYLTETKSITKKSLTQPSYYYFREKYYFWLKMLTFCQETAKININLEKNHTVSSSFQNYIFFCIYITHCKFLV